MNTKYTGVKGTRDFIGKDLRKRNYLLITLKSCFESFNFQELQTPSFEKLETLIGKYGDEETNLMYKIISSGEKVKKADIQALKDGDLTNFSNSISDKGLRYDLTIPLSRFVRDQKNFLRTPFKRYQIQNVWRAERPQKGRFREFLQCDIDTIGKSSYHNVVESILLCDMVFHKLGFKKLKLRINDVGILYTFGMNLGLSTTIDLTVSPQSSYQDFASLLDKKDKIGLDKIIEKLDGPPFVDDSPVGNDARGLKSVIYYLTLKGTPQEKLNDISEYVDPSWGGVGQLEKVFSALSKVKLKVLDIDLDFCLARGLNYYTGIIMEISSPDEMPIGSIVGGGRYDDLVNKGDKNTSGFGISFGFDRIKLIMDELNLFPESTNNPNSFLFLNFGEELSHEILKYITELRYSGIVCELYPNDIKMKKQLDYANDKKFDFVILFGLDEHKKNEFTIKDMNTGKQKSHNLSKIVDEIKKLS